MEGEFIAGGAELYVSYDSEREVAEIMFKDVASEFLFRFDKNNGVIKIIIKDSKGERRYETVVSGADIDRILEIIKKIRDIEKFNRGGQWPWGDIFA